MLYVICTQVVDLKKNEILFLDLKRICFSHYHTLLIMLVQEKKKKTNKKGKVPDMHFDDPP